ncbi:hypothetical protein [Saccharopolyspora spinosa]|uniref:hypothetical protein n=1 Tax=Saccharopolyspora spinosa TaxID=60894 RepID=UPI003748AFB5
MWVDGTELVVLTAHDYENLVPTPSGGAQAARNRALRSQLDLLSSFVDELGQAVTRLPEYQPTPCAACARTDDECARQALIDALTNRPHQTRGRQS